MRKARTSTGGIAYSRSGQGPAVLLLHGIPGSGAEWDGVAADLCTDYDVIVPDLVGFGKSIRRTSLNDLHAAAQARAMCELLNELGVETAAVAGHDLGGPVAVAMHALRPDAVSHLALLSSNTFTDTPIPFPLSAVVWPGIGRFAAALLFSRPSLRVMLRQGVGTPKRRLDPAIYLGDGGQAVSIRTIFAGSLAQLHDLYGPIEAEMAKVTVPALVCWGGADPFFPRTQGERTAAALSAPLRVYPGAGHFLPEERAGEVAADLRELLRME